MQNIPTQHRKSGHGERTDAGQRNQEDWSSRRGRRGALSLSGQADREHFIVLCLDTKHNITAVHTASIGSLNAAIVHPREVVKVAILATAAAVIVAHNHPSGDPTPSEEDIALTERLVSAGRILGIEVLDHLVLGDQRFVSLRERRGRFG